MGLACAMTWHLIDHTGKKEVADEISIRFSDPEIYRKVPLVYKYATEESEFAATTW